MFCFVSHTVEQQINLQQEVAREPDWSHTGSQATLANLWAHGWAHGWAHSQLTLSSLSAHSRLILSSTE